MHNLIWKNVTVLNSRPQARPLFGIVIIKTKTTAVLPKLHICPTWFSCNTNCIPKSVHDMKTY